ncbi:Acidic 27 kDa endochitinase [Morus notabilis]|uniref:Acidic 27 kDa endochitinase n=1 Tax=Morus notabilis TaxID=981085 RepID=W9QSI3_9ROSA|nr:Acidic 27 kDa endochitinase [Morus notabilis]
MRKILKESLFDEMFKHRKDCPSQGFYSYDAFINAAESFPFFGNTGDLATPTTTMGVLHGEVLGLKLINNPDLVVTDPIVSFKITIWFWMTGRGNKMLILNLVKS